MLEKVKRVWVSGKCVGKTVKNPTAGNGRKPAWAAYYRTIYAARECFVFLGYLPTATSARKTVLEHVRK